MKSEKAQRIPLQLTCDYIVASIQIDLSEEVILQFRNDLLSLLQSSGARGVIVDLSGIEIMDLEDFEALRKTMSMVEVMGAQTIIAGLRAGVVSSLVELGANIKKITAVPNLDEAFKLTGSFKTFSSSNAKGKQQNEFKKSMD
jgi:rsbT antagonist protein RsbS